jgi:hypothetical protein
MLKRITLTALTIGAIVLLAMPAFASLVPMSWGFPSMVQDSSLTSFESAFSNNFDIESADIAFPSTACGTLGMSFPTISQTGNIGSTLSQVAFANQKEYSQFAYPWLSIGGSPVPSLGLF